MSFFKLHQPMEFKHRYIYYDPKKEAQKEREQRIAEQKAAQSDDGSKGEFKTSLRRGSFREMAERNKNSKASQNRQSNTRLIIIILILVLIAYFLMK